MSSGLGVAVHELRHLPAVWRAGRRPPAEIERRALAGVNRMLAFARTRVPYYRDRPEYAGPPLRTVAELTRLPILDKPAVVAELEQFHTPGLAPRQYKVDNTSGSTGQRLMVRHDLNAYGYHGATIVRRFRETGYRPWWRIAQLKGTGRPVRWFQRLGVFPRVVVPAGLPADQLTQRVLAVRPRVVMGYPVMLRALLRSLSSAETAQLRRTLRLLLTDSELLTEPVAAELSHGFGVPVFDEYSAFEVLTVASQCRSGSMHVDEDRVWLEIVDEDGQPAPDGTAGAVVVTHFRERAMPLVRYRLGDRARLIPGRCGCGQGFRRIKLVDGRTNDYLVLPDGQRVYSAVVLWLMMQAPGVGECMVRQDETGTITVHLVPDPRDPLPRQEAADRFAQSFAAAVGTPVELRFAWAERIELTAGGKGRVIESAYRPDHGRSRA